MVDIYKYLNELDLNEIVALLEKDNDIDNVMIILQMFDINTLVELEKLKEKIKELAKENDDEEDDLLTAINEKQKEIKKLQEEQKQLEEKRKKTKSVMQSILSQPAKFWESNDIDSFANSLLGTILVPKTKEKRSLLAVSVINGILLGKNKSLNVQKTDDKQTAINKIKEYKAKSAIFAK